MRVIAVRIAAGGTHATMVAASGMLTGLCRMARLHVARESSANRAGQGQTYLYDHGLGAVLHPTFMISEVDPGCNRSIGWLRHGADANTLP